MSELVSLGEAATYLGVSKATLRNWDRAGKLRSTRHPVNDYRLFSLDELRKIQSQLTLFEESPVTDVVNKVSARDIKRLISRLHNTLRDNDGNSNLLERFDELSKLLFIGMMAGRKSNTNEILRDYKSSDAEYAKRLRSEYESLINETGLPAPLQFQQLTCSDRALVEGGRALAAVDFAGSDIDLKGMAYEEVIKRTFDKTDNQQFFTPAAIVRFMVELLGTVSGDVCDPAAGTGGFLVEVARRKFEYKSLTALEIDQRLAWTAGLNILLHGGENVFSSFVPDGGSLGQNGEKYFSRFDTIITNPPFGSDFSDIGEMSKYALGKGRSSRRRGIMFVERCCRMLREGGRLAIILDEGVLNLPHAQDVREFILNHFHLDAIISLPETAFMPYANVNAAILLMTKGKHNLNKQTFFGKSEKIGRRANGDDDIVYEQDGTTRINSDLSELLEGWRGNLIDDELAFWAQIDPDEPANPDLRLDFRYHHPSRDAAARRLSLAEWPLYRVADLCEEINELLIPAKEMPDSVILYTGLAHIEPRSGKAYQEPTSTNSLKSSVKRYEPGDILFAKMRPNLRKVALMNCEEAGYASPECMVLRPRKNATASWEISPTILAALLRSELVYGQLMHLIAGIGRPRLSGKHVKQVQLPVPPRDLQESIRRRFETHLEAAEAIREQAKNMVIDADKREYFAIEEVALAAIGGL